MDLGSWRGLFCGADEVIGGVVEVIAVVFGCRGLVAGSDWNDESPHSLGL
jgi:hypothetical protein